MLIDQIDRVKGLVKKIQELEHKLVNTSFMPLEEQRKLHDEIRRYKEEMALLEQRTRQRR